MSDAPTDPCRYHLLGMSPVRVTLRDPLKGKISDLLEDARMTCHETEESLIALAVDLADYREEGTQLYPRVVVCDDLSNTLRLLQGSTPIEIGHGPRGAITARDCLKKCAPLASSGWLVWIEREADRFRFGVFRAPASPTAVDLRSTLADMDAESVHALLLSQLAPGTVEIVGPGLDGVLVHLSGERTEVLPSASQQDRLSNWFMEDANTGHMQDPCVSFARNLFGNLLRESHGALIAFVQFDAEVPEALRADGTFLDVPLNLAELVVRHSADETTENYTDLMSSAGLLGGMLNCDGITVLDTSGRVLGYNCFVRTTSDTLKPSELVGGARRRAFTELVSVVNAGHLRGAFIRSSDGASDFHGGDK